MMSRPVTAFPPRPERMDVDRLLAAIHGNDPAAFRELYERYSPSLRRGIRRFTSKVPHLRLQEEDVVSFAWMRLLARQRKLLRSYDPKRASFGRFMALVGANSAWKMAALKPEPAREGLTGEDTRSIEELVQVDDIETVLVDRELLTKLSEALERALSREELKLFEDVVVQQRSAREVAQELELSEAVVWKRVSRLRKKVTQIAEAVLHDAGPPTHVAPLAAVLVSCMALIGFAGDGLARDPSGWEARS